MKKRKNLVHKKIREAKPTDLIQFQVKLPAGLLKDVNRYGEASKVIRRALILAQKTKFKYSLIEIIGDIKKEIDKLETVRDHNREELSEDHFQLLEIYKDVYFKLKKARILKRKTEKHS